MVGASKILTVSYGTFSCTLEGFDDPFSTMKAIAEYFRDLAADDRYFGAEPPQPDAAMLHRIAEREGQRRVEARVQDNSVVLRAAEQPAAPAAEPARIVRPPVEVDDAAVTVAPSRVAPTLTPADSALSLSVAEKLRRLRTAAPAVVAAPVAVEAVADPAPAAERLPHGFADEADEVAESLAPAPVAEIPPKPAAEARPAPDMVEAPAEALPEPVAAEIPEAVEPLPEAGAPVVVPVMEEAAPQAEAFAPETVEPVAPVADTVAVPATAEAGGDLPLAAPEAETLAEGPASALAAEADEGAAPVAEAMPAPVFDAAPEPPAAFIEAAVAVVANEPEAQPALQNDTIWGDLAEDDDALIAALVPDVLVPADAELAAPTAADDDDDETAALLAAIAEELAPAAPAAPVTVVPVTDTMAEDADTEALISALFDAPAAVTGVDQPLDEYAADSDVEATVAAFAAEIEVGGESEADDVAVMDHPAAMPEDVPAVEDGAMPAPEPAADTAPQDQPEAAGTEAGADLADETPEPVDAPQAADETPDSAVAPLAAAELATVAAATATVAPPDDTPASERLQRARARVIRIRRIEPAATTAPLDAEAEAALERELADLRGAADPATAPLPETRPLAEVRAAETALAPRTGLPAAAEDDSVRRLLDTANSQMEEPESRRRMSAIAHLKAAVAATVADRRVTGDAVAPQAEARRLDPYRSDLEQVTRPRRPVSTGAQTPRPTETSPRPAPLVLVSEQRIDRLAPAPQPARMPAPVRPRRVGSLSVATAPQAVSAMAAQDEDEDHDLDVAEDTANIFAGGASFADFAERLGARELTDLLEAAAVYAACVEGRPSVTRPQLMRTVLDALPEGEPVREDMLRSFGRLLRDGRIEKVKRGQFAVPDGARVLQQGRQITG